MPFLALIRRVHPIQIICAFCVGCIVTAFPVAVVHALYPAIGVCYATDGKTVETTFIDGGANFYPVATNATIDHLNGSMIITHTTTFGPRGGELFLPLVVNP
jgi:hypothetical protein